MNILADFTEYSVFCLLHFFRMRRFDRKIALSNSCHFICNASGQLRISNGEKRLIKICVTKEGISKKNRQNNVRHKKAYQRKKTRQNDVCDKIRTSKRHFYGIVAIIFVHDIF